jgi:hypothetical protein
MDEKIIYLGVIEIKFLSGFSRMNELYAIKGSGWRLPTEAEMEYISDLYINYDIIGIDGWYWTDSGVLYELETQSHFKPNNDNESGGVILVRVI